VGFYLVGSKYCSFLYQGAEEKDGTLIISVIAGFIVLFINNSILRSIAIPQWALLLQIAYFFGVIFFTVENKYEEESQYSRVVV